MCTTSLITTDEKTSLETIAGWILVAGTLFLMVYTPVSMIAQTNLTAVLLLLISIAYTAYFSFVRQHAKAVTAILLFLMANVALSPLPKDAATGAFNVFKGLWLFPVAILVYPLFTRRRFGWSALLLCVLNSLAALALLVWVVDWSNTYRSLLVWSNKHAGNLHNLNNFLFVSDLLALTLILRYQERLIRFGALLCLLPLVVLSVLVQSEGSALAMFCTFTLLAALYFQGRLRTCLLALSALPIIALQLFYTFPELLTALTGLKSHTLNIRSEIYAQLLEAWQERPFTGWGIATYKYVEGTAISGREFLYPHNLYLEALFSLGIIGTLFIVLAAARILRRIDYCAAIHNPVQLFALATLSYLSIKGMSDMKLMSAHTIGWFSLCLGLLLASNSRYDHIRKAEDYGIYS
jgi:O-antigen ligase